MRLTLPMRVGDELRVWHLYDGEAKGQDTQNYHYSNRTVLMTGLFKLDLDILHFPGKEQHSRQVLLVFIIRIYIFFYSHFVATTSSGITPSFLEFLWFGMTPGVWVLITEREAASLSKLLS